MSIYNVIVSTDESTVVAEYIPDSKRAKDYQSEAELEQDFIQRLVSLGYEYVSIRSEADLIANLRRQLELVNEMIFSDGEWKQFFSERLSNGNEGIRDKTYKIQDDLVQILKRDDGSTKNITLIHKSNIHANRLQVLNQYEEEEGTRKTRYDVTMLVNGLPLVHMELKRLAVAMNLNMNFL